MHAGSILCISTQSHSFKDYVVYHNPSCFAMGPFMGSYSYLGRIGEYYDHLWRGVEHVPITQHTMMQFFGSSTLMEVYSFCEVEGGLNLFTRMLPQEPRHVYMQYHSPYASRPEAWLQGRYTYVASADEPGWEHPRGRVG